MTTHNLAVLFDALGLVRTLQPALDDLARRCFRWICRRLQTKIDPRKAQLQTVKNAAYAWRQMVFFLALSPGDRVEEFMAWATEHLGQQNVRFQTRFQPALQGLALAIRGVALPPAQDEHDGARRLLGWATEKHWLLVCRGISVITSVIVLECGAFRRFFFVLECGAFRRFFLCERVTQKILGRVTVVATECLSEKKRRNTPHSKTKKSGGIRRTPKRK